MILKTPSEDARSFQSWVAIEMRKGEELLLPKRVSGS